MTAEFAEAQWLCEQSEISVEQLAELSGLPAELLRELVDYGALVPLDAPAGAGNARPESASAAAQAHWSFAADCVMAVRAARRLRDDFDLDANALAVALTLIERIQALEARLREMHSQFPRTRLAVRK